MAYTAAGHGERVCAGIAHYLDVPVKLVRIPVVLSIFLVWPFHLCRLHRTDVCVGSDARQRGFGEQQPSSGELLDAVDRELAASEKRLREMERYVTSDTFTLRSRFRQL